MNATAEQEPEDVMCSECGAVKVSPESEHYPRCWWCHDKPEERD